jgi:hypothetical protein
MAEPSDKSPAMEQFLEKTFGRTTAIKTGTCVSCKGPASHFRDAISKKEFTISGLCQACQDDTFGNLTDE